MAAVVGSLPPGTVGLTIGTLGPGKSVTITFDATINGTLTPSTASEICNQGIVSGSNFVDELTDDPDLGDVADATCTPLDGAELGDFVWHDLNGNGIQESGEPGIDGVTVELLNASLSTVDTTTTAGGGLYSFTDVAPGQYRIEVTIPAGSAATAPHAGGDDAVDSDINVSGLSDPIVLVTGEENLTVDAGLVFLVQLGDTVWEDQDADGVQDPGEPGMAGITIELRNAANAVIATQATDANGNYLFTGLLPGTYSADVDESTLPVGSVPTFDLDGIGTPHIATLTLSSGDSRLDVDFGYSPIAFSINDVALAEGNAGTTTFTFTVSRTGGAITQETIDVQSAAITATAGTDYTDLVLTTLIFNVGVSDLTVDIDVAGDTTVELDETFSVDLSNPSTGGILDGQGIGTILNDDTAALSIGDVTLNEADGPANFSLTLSQTLDVDLSVDFATADGSANAGSDYFAAAGTLAIPAGSTSATVSVSIIDDFVSEPDEDFFLNLSNLAASGRAVSLADAQGRGLILNDDILDISLDKDDGGIIAGFGDTVVYTLTVENSGNVDATGVVISESIPANTLFNAAASDAGWVCADIIPGSACTLNLGTLAPGPGVQIAFAASVGTGCILPPLVDNVSNSASVAEDGTHGPDEDPLNNSDGDTTPVDAAPDLVVEKTDGLDEAQPGDTLTYTIEVSNVGDQAASGVVLTETVPQFTTFDPAISTAGWACVPDFNAGSVCTLPISVPSCVIPGTTVTFTVVVDNPLPSGATEAFNEVTAADDGTNGPDQTPGDNTDTDTTALNTPPEAEAGGPYDVNEGQTVELDASGTTDAEQATATLVFEWDLDGDGTFGEVGAVAERGNEVGINPTFSAVGLDGPLLFTVELLVTDDGGLTDFDSADIDVHNVAPTVTAAPAAQSVQYSDPIADVTLTVSDIADDSLALVSVETDVDGGGFAAGLPDFYSLGFDSCSVVGNTNTCTWTLSGLTGVPAGVYTIRTTFDDDDGAETSVDITITVFPEDATVIFDQNNPVGVQVEEDGGDSGPFSLTVFVMETLPDLSATLPAAPGDISLAGVSMTLQPIGPGGSVAGTCTPMGVVGTGYDAILTVTCDFDDVEVNTYSAMATVTGGYYTGSGEDVVTIFDPSLGFTTGGGWFYWPGTDDPSIGYPGDKTNVGFDVKYKRRGRGAKGNLLMIRHLPDGSKFRVKSNAMDALALGEVGGAHPYAWASFTGKATYLEPGWTDPIGNYEFIAYVEDHGTPGAGADRFWIEVIDRDGFVVSASSLAEPAPANAETIEGGNIVVPQGNGRRGSR
ncbi:MAG: SdrD B-like domain-containing protein [Planctomycetota bacterium]